MRIKGLGGGSLTYRLARIGDRLPIIGHIRRNRTRKSNVLRGLGVILFWVSLLSLMPIAPAYVHYEPYQPFFVTFLITFFISITLMLCFGSSKVYHHTDGPMIVILLWITLFIVGMIPYIVAGVCNPIDALFESVSGFTTVGVSIFELPETLPSSILFWRVLTQWIGGIVIVLLFMVILPMFVPGRRGLVTDDIKPISDNDGVQLKTGDVAKQFIVVYLVLTILFSVIVWVARTDDMGFDEAVQIAMSTISVGGFTPTSHSLTDLSNLQKILVAFMMIISATNFYLHFRAAVKRELGIYSHDTEFKTMIIWYLFLTLFLFLILKDNFVNGFFMLISFATTTGFVSDPTFATWAPGVLIVLATATFIGGCTGSPAGGIKVSRVIIIVKSIVIDAFQMINTSLVQVPKINGKPVSEKMVHNAYAVFTLTIIVIVITTVVYSITDNLNLQEAMFTSISLVSLTGTTTGVFASSFAAMSVAGKIFTCILMLFARMEIIMLIALFMPKFWAEVIKNSDGIRGQNTKKFSNTRESFLDRIKRK